MASYIAKRILLMIPTLLLVGLISYAVVALWPGDFFNRYRLLVAHAGFDPDAWHEEVLMLRGLDKPWIVQFYYWAEGILVHGDFGYSFFDGRPVIDVILGPELGWTLIIVLGGLFFAYLLGIPAGVYSAIKYGKRFDLSLTAVTFTLSATPPQLLALGFIYGVCKLVNPLIIQPGVWGLVHWDLVFSPLTWAKAMSHLFRLIPAWIIVGAPSFAYIVRYIRLEVRDQFAQPYMDTARGKGLSERRAQIRHAFRNALGPVISMSGFVLTTSIGWAMLGSTFLGMPAFGAMTVTAAKRQDQPLFTAILVTYGVLLVVGTLISDLLLLCVDPRIRYD